MKVSLGIICAIVLDVAFLPFTSSTEEGLCNAFLTTTQGIFSRYKKENCIKDKNNGVEDSFSALEQEVAGTIETLSKKYAVEHVSKRWVSAMLGSASDTSSTKSGLDLAQKEIENNMKYIQSNMLNEKVDACMKGDCDDYVSHQLKQGCFYWYGVDKDGAPILWYRIENFDWKSLDVAKQMDFSSIIIQGAINQMPSNVHDFNFIMLVDNYPVMEMVKHPKFGVAFLSTFMKVCPGRLKRSVMVTGRAGEVFYKIAKRVAPKEFVEKITTVPSRQRAVEVLLDMEILPSKEETPDFLGGSFVHGDEVAKVFSNMMTKVRMDMMGLRP